MSPEQTAALLRQRGASSSPEEQALADMSPVDAYRFAQELRNRQRVGPEQASANRQQNLRDLLSIVPGPGNVIAAEDAYNAFGDAASAAGEGRYGRAALMGGLGMLSGLGAVTGFPTGRLAGNAARGARDVVPAFPAWHGSPHDFDEFKLDKIGTGEGAQAYGHGLYFAESQAVARQYKNDLAGKVITADGNPVDLNNLAVRNAAHAKAKGEFDELYEGGKRSLQGFEAMRERAIREGNPTAKFDKIIAETRKELADIEHLRTADVKVSPGYIYRTEIDAEPHQLLDWDKPLSQHPEEVRAPLMKLLDQVNEQRGSPWASSISGSGLYGALVHQRGQQGASQALREAGIPGIRYYDGFSRTGGVGGSGERTSNYVIFDDKLTKILSKE